MLHVNLTVAKHLSDEKARRVIDQLVTSLSGHADVDGRMTVDFAPAGERQVQGAFHSAEHAVGFILSAARSEIWGVQLSLVPNRQNEQLQASNIDVMPYMQAKVGEASTAAVRAPGGVAVRLLQADALVSAKIAPELGPVESALQLLCVIEQRRSAEGQEAGFMVNAGTSQTMAARKLGVSQQAVSARLQSGYWYESRRMAYWLAVQIHELIES